MTSTEEARPTSVDRDTATFESLNPTSGAVVATFPIDGDVAVRFAVERARIALEWW